MEEKRSIPPEMVQQDIVQHTLQTAAKLEADKRKNLEIELEMKHTRETSRKEFLKQVEGIAVVPPIVLIAVCALLFGMILLVAGGVISAQLSCERKDEDDFNDAAVIFATGVAAFVLSIGFFMGCCFVSVFRLLIGVKEKTLEEAKKFMDEERTK